MTLQITAQEAESIADALEAMNPDENGHQDCATLANRIRFALDDDGLGRIVPMSPSNVNPMEVA